MLFFLKIYAANIAILKMNSYHCIPVREKTVVKRKTFFLAHMV
jgi:hypothetical protein